MSTFDHFDFTDLRVCVTGAAGGIGSAMARAFSALGASVLLADRDRANVKALASELGKRVRWHHYEQTNIASIEGLVEVAGELDVLLNNAAILLYEPLLDLKWDDLRRQIDTNLVGVIALTQLVGAQMVQQKQGTIIHTGSRLAFNGAEFRAIYAAAKAGISQFTKTAALEWGPHGVRVNCIAPGRTLTNMNRRLLSDPADYAEGLKRIPLGRYGRPEDMANAAVFLASDAASYITGHTLIVDGGWILP